MNKSIWQKLFLINTAKEEGDFSSYLRRIDSGSFSDRLVYGIAEDKRGFDVVDPVQTPGALYCGAMGSGKSIAMRFTLTTTLLSSSENTMMILVDPLKGMTDYAVLYNPDKGFDATANVAKALNDPAKLVAVIELVQKECDARKFAFSEVGASNIYDYERIKRKQDPNYKGLARIIIAIEEFHAVPNAQEIKFHQNVERQGSTAYYLKELLRVGRSYGITFLLATQRATSDDIPSTLKTGLSRLLGFRVNNIGDVSFMNLPQVADIKSGQPGRCAYEFGFMQFPYADDPTIIKLLNKYYKPLSAELLTYQMKDYHLAFSGEGNQGLVEVKPIKDLLDTINQWKTFDVISRILRTFDFKVESQNNTAYVAQAVAEKNGKKYAVLIIERSNQMGGGGGLNYNSEKVVNAYVDGAKKMKCDSLMVIAFDSMSLSSLVNRVSKESGIVIDRDDLYRIAQIVDNKQKLEKENQYEEMFNSLPLAKIGQEEVKEESDITSHVGDLSDELDAIIKLKEDKKKIKSLVETVDPIDQIIKKPLADKESMEKKEVTPKRVEVSTGGSTSLSLRDRLRNSLLITKKNNN